MVLQARKLQIQVRKAVWFTEKEHCGGPGDLCFHVVTAIYSQYKPN